MRAVVAVVDANIFVWSTYLLNKEGGPDLLRLLRATDGRLLIPDVLRQECIEHAVGLTDAWRKKVEDTVDDLGTLLNMRLTNDFPSKSVAQAAVAARLQELDSLTLKTASTPELLTAAGLRVLAKIPPVTSKAHGYKDCMIWESVLRLPKGSIVRLVSRDEGFFLNDALHPNLIGEAKDREIDAAGYKNIKQLVKELTVANSTLDLAALEAEELARATPRIPAEVPSPVSAPLRSTSQAEAAPDTRDVAERLAEAERRFAGIDLKVLGYVAYMGSPSKADLFDALAASGTAADVATNVADRLALSGFLKDTGHHYLVVDADLAEAVAPTVESEMIAWLKKTAARR